MKWMGAFGRRLSVLFRRDRLDRELEEEMRFHLEMQAEENRQNGMDADEARYAARREFGNVALLKEAGWEMWGWASVERFLQDVRYAARMLRRNPGFAMVAVLTLSLGIGVNTSIFSFVDRLLLRPLPFPESARLVSLGYHSDTGTETYQGLSFPDYLYYRDHSEVLSGLAAYGDVDADVQFGDRTENLAGEIVSANYFSILGVQAALGRSFVPEEDQIPNARPSVILSYGLWRSRFGGDPEAIGRQIIMNHRGFSVVGVAPRGFAGLRLDRSAPPDFWVPTMMYPTIATFAADIDLRNQWGTHWLEAVGRLKAEMGLKQADAAFARLSFELKQGPWQEVWGKPELVKVMGKHNPLLWTATLIPAGEMRLQPQSRNTIAASLGMLAAAVGIVLLIACFNVANLLLARASGRQREMAVRLAIGAGRARLMRQLATEGLVLSLLGGSAGLLVAVLTSDFLAGFPLPFRFPLLLETGVEPRVLGFALLVSMLTGVLFGLVPAREAMRTSMTAALKVDPGCGARLRRWNARNVFMVVQAALSVVLLVGAGLFLRTLANARAADITADPGNVLMTNLNVAALKYDEARGQAFYTQLLERMEALPGVRSAALVMVVPMGGRRGGTDVSISTANDPAEKRTLQVDFNIVSPKYFETVGLPLVRGRAFTSYDRAGAAAAAIVNEQWAQQFWPGQDPVGKRFEVEQPRRTVEIMGVVRDGKFRNYRAAIKPCFYMPLAQNYWGMMNLELRTAGNPTGLAAAVRGQVQALEKNLPVSQMVTLKSYRDAGLGQERMTAGLLSGLGLLALILAAIGIYGIMSFSVAQRKREIGIRIALGARAGEVLRMVLGQGLALMLIGSAIGLAAAAAAVRFIASLLYGVSPTDPWTFATITLVLTATALLACYIPARRATRIDPMEALRNE
ncbi:MAG: ABC transporter permease [Acidobacteriia bacterium]|nr:ABC transporter permease [Terriglobia bacterium]